MNTDSNQVASRFQNRLPVAPVTPFDSAEELNCELIETPAEVLTEHQVEDLYY